jgi:hypothetical protein
LNQKEKLNWKNCILEKDKEEELAQKISQDLEKEVRRHESAFNH